MLIEPNRRLFPFQPLAPASDSISFCIVLFTFLVFLNVSSLAQDKPKPKKDSASFGIQAGLSFSHFNVMHVPSYYPGGQNIVGFRGGVNGDFPLTRHISLRPEILFTQKGYKVHDVEDSIYLRTRLSYLKFPVNVVFKLLALDHGTVAKDFLKFGVGPYFAYAIHGTYTAESVSSSVKFSNHQVSATPASYGAYYKRYDAGVNYFLEFNLGKFYSQVGAAMGMTNIKPTMENAPTPHQSVYRNSCFNLSYGWRL